jgi:uncharacterized protein with gpF-like domain
MAELKTIAHVRANRGVESHYRRKLQEMIAEMHGSIEYWLVAAYNKNPPRMAALIAQDASPSDKVRKILAELAKKWIKRFEDAAPSVAEAYVKSMYSASDTALKKALNDVGWSVQFKFNPTMRDAFDASLNGNVSLIKSIPQEYLTEVEGIISRTYSGGRDLQQMVKELKLCYPKAADRAETIARDQSNKANAVVNQARQLEIGIVEGIWMHSGAGKVPRPSHLAAGKEKRRFKIAEGCLIDGEKILPGEKINCRCSWRGVLPYGND